MNIDDLIYQVNFGEKKQRAQAIADIWQAACDQGAIPSSIKPVFTARAEKKLLANFTIPAINLRGMTYLAAQKVYTAAKNHKTGLFIFELARSEMSYTDQPPSVYMANILAAAIKTEWRAPIFLQADHFQIKTSDGKNQNEEIDKLKSLIIESLSSGFYQLDIDGSPLIDYSQQDLHKQQQSNADFVAKMVKHIQINKPDKVEVGIGCEISKIGIKRNSIPEDLIAFANNFKKHCPSHSCSVLTKAAIQTGSSHGGVILPDGTIAPIQIDFDIIKTMTNTANELGLGGVVQHGGSTLERNIYQNFPSSGAIEIHLSTGFQNIIFDHPKFPKELSEQINSWCQKHCDHQQGSEETKEQFFYKNRKKAWGQFKKEIWQIDEEIQTEIGEALQNEFEYLFEALSVNNTDEIVKKYIRSIKIEKIAGDFTDATEKNLTDSNDSDLDD